MNMLEYQAVRRNPTVFRKVLRLGLEDIANTAHCANHLAAEFSVDLASQSADKNLDNVCLGIKTVVPYVFQDHGFGNNPSGIAHQVFQESKFSRGQINLFTRSEDFSRKQICRQITHGEPAWFRGSGRPSDEGAYPGHQFCEGKGFG